MRIMSGFVAQQKAKQQKQKMGAGRLAERSWPPVGKCRRRAFIAPRGMKLVMSVPPHAGMAGAQQQWEWRVYILTRTYLSYYAL
jgi:hypothetical protein